MAELVSTLTWTFSKACNIPAEVSTMLIAGEEALCAYQTIRDVALFTNKRLIVRDAQGITGKKIEIYSLPYSSITMWSTENGGKVFDLNSEVELWTKTGNIKINLNKAIDIREFDKVLANAILSSKFE
ncbi:MAG: PH domain-containing protein [Culicoidibacterales bacterium]